METCVSCKLVARRDKGEAPLWDNILRTEQWDLVHNYATSLPGWLCLVSRRHIPALQEMTEAESAELGPLVQRISAALQTITNCEKTYVMQFADHPDHPHVHWHIVPRMADLPPAHKGPNIMAAYMGVDEPSRVSEDEMNAIASKVRDLLST